MSSSDCNYSFLHCQEILCCYMREVLIMAPSWPLSTDCLRYTTEHACNKLQRLPVQRSP